MFTSNFIVKLKQKASNAQSFCYNTKKWYKTKTSTKKLLFPGKRYIFTLLAILFTTFIAKYKDEIEITVRINKFMNLYTFYNEQPPGYKHKKELKPKHPVIIISGFCSNNLELWNHKNNHFEFRKNVWGTIDMLFNRVGNKINWIKSLLLDPITGLDPAYCKVRAANGLSSSDYLFPGFWVWQKILNNLGIIGYDHNNIHVSSYDWRLGCDDLELRDKYFSRLKLEIEMYHKLNNEKVVILSHSLGSVTFLYFMNWVDEKEKGFLDKYITDWVSIASPFLGAAKCISGILTGESRSSTTLFEGNIHEFFIDTKTRKKLLNNWMSVKTLLPKGGKKIWGKKPVVNINGDVYDIVTIIKMIEGRYAFDNAEKAFNDKIKRNLKKTLDTIRNILKDKNYTRKGSEENKFILHAYLEYIRRQKTRRWTDPLQNPLPNAPKMKIYAFYGIGHMTERAYYMVKDKNGSLKIDRNYKSDNPNVRGGIELCDGDGTVTLFSCGYMPYRGWKSSKNNPSGIKTIVREYMNKSETIDRLRRGGPLTSEHLDILGNHDVTEDILRIVCGFELNDKIESNIEEICNEIDNEEEI